MIRNPVNIAKQQITHKYDDIINMEYPLRSSDRIKHPRMTTADRAKIFAPFAALKGYEEAIAEREQLVRSRIESAGKTLEDKQTPDR